jgi:hypothetical protein
VVVARDPGEHGQPGLLDVCPAGAELVLTWSVWLRCAGIEARPPERQPGLACRSVATAAGCPFRACPAWIGVTGDPCTVPSAFTLLLFGELAHGGGTAATSRSARLASPAGGRGPAHLAVVAAAAGGCGAGRGPVPAAGPAHPRRLQGAAAAGGSEPGRAGRADPARPRAGAGLGGGRPRRRSGRDRRRPPWARPGPGGVRRPVAGRQRRVAGRGRGRVHGHWRGAVCAGDRRSRVR